MLRGVFLDDASERPFGVGDVCICDLEHTQSFLVCYNVLLFEIEEGLDVKVA